MNTENISVLDLPYATRHDRDNVHAAETATDVIGSLLDILPNRDVISTGSALGEIAFHTVSVPAQSVRFHVARGVDIPSWFQGAVEVKHDFRYFSVDIEADLEFVLPDDKGGLTVQYKIVSG